MSTAIPITRSSRMVTLDATAGQTVFTYDAGPVWDTADLVVQSKLATASRFTTLTTGFTPSLIFGGTGGATITFALAPRPTAGDPPVQVRIVSRRIHERVTDVTRANKIHGPSVEAEHDKLTTTLQELRRDIDLNDTDQQASLAALDASLRGALSAALLGQIPDRSLTEIKLVAGLLRPRRNSQYTLYVRTDGNDANDGLANTPVRALATIQAAINKVRRDVDLNGQDAVILVQAGTYTAGGVLNGEGLGQGLIQIWGDLSTPSNVVVSTTGNCFLFTNGANGILRGFKVISASGSGIEATTGAAVTYGNIDFGTCGYMHIDAGSGATAIEAYNNAITGGAVAHYHVGSPGTLVTGATTNTLTGTPNFSAYFAGVSQGALTVGGATFVGAATGRRFWVHKNGTIDVGFNGRNHLPGDQPGFEGGDGYYAHASSEQNDLGHRNIIINPFGRVNQRNVGAGALTDGSFGVDRWIGLSQSNPITMAGTGGATPMIRLTQANASAQRMGAAHQVEANDCRWLTGRTLTFSGRFQFSAAQRINWAILEWTGSANVATRDVVNDWTNATLTPGNFFVSTNYNVLATGGRTPAANTLTDIDPITVTVGASMANLVFFIWTDQPAAQNVTLDFVQQAERGTRATQLEHRPLQDELLACLRFYQTIPGVGVQGIVSGGAGIFWNVPLRTTMRASPTIALAKTSYAAASFEILTAATWQDNASASLSSTNATTLAFNTIMGGFSGLTAGQAAMISTTQTVFTASAEIGA